MLKDYFFKKIFLLGTYFRNKKIFENYNFLIESQQWSVEKLKDHQLKKLKELIQFAYDNSIFYQKLFHKNNIKPADITCLEDIKKIPELEKDTVLANVEEIQIKNIKEKLYYSETSGSSGKPLVFYRNMDWDAFHNASVFRGFSWHGVKPWEKNGYLWGFNFSWRQKMKVRILDFLQNRFRLFTYNDEEFNYFIKKLKDASYIGGYSSMIYEIAKKVNSMGENKPSFNMKMIRGTSEKIFDSYHEPVQKAFGRKIISEYGSAESGIIAFECERGNMHMNMETVIVEVLDSEIVVTNLVSKSFPIVRYRLGDYIEIDTETQCPCGRSHYIVKEVTGRVGKKIVGKNNEYPSLTLYYVFKNLAMEHDVILNYQAIQTKKGEIDLNIEQKLDDGLKGLLEKEFIKYFDSDIELTVFDQVNLKSNNRKKQDFVSEL